MLYDFVISYSMNGLRHEFLASATSNQFAFDDFLAYLHNELGWHSADLYALTVGCEGPSAIQF